jgi:hypothetical protein
MQFGLAAFAELPFASEVDTLEAEIEVLRNG